MYVIGKNGEKRADAKVAINVVHKWFSQDDSGKGQKIVLVTDQEGKVNLGKLPKVS